ncbi:MAG: Gfo/Idh/MocA family oxidoreductase [Oscillospiraceae bacterium]|nr:Gfo/Idh/MocA family oxidoreductase [Oscillospiraceae bacterium]
MSQPVTFAICGCGARGLEAYAPYQERHPDEMKVVAGADIRPERLAMLRERYGVPPERCFASGAELLAQPRLADVMIVATQDRQHVSDALAALDKGYHVLLEKPISPNLEECRALQKKAHETGKVVVVCHVLRYTRFYSVLEELLRQGEIGKLETIDAIEHVAYWHQAHSFVRGNWRNDLETSPMILQKSCHDMDILRWLAGEPCLKVQSFGALDYFTAENAPDGAALRCLDGCKCKDDCPYDAEKIYITDPRTGVHGGGKGWPCGVLVSDPTEEKLREALRTGPYGRCVFHCDNNVVDHQTVNLEFASHIHATFTMTAFTQSCHRTIKVTGTLGEIEGDMAENTLHLRRFGRPERIIDLREEGGQYSGHGGGDFGLISSFCKLIADGGSRGLTDVDASVESHVMALAAEASRLVGGKTITLADF